jgi:TonB family protein
MMKRLASVLALLLTFALAHTALGQSGSEWLAVASDDGQFTVQMPAKPEAKTQKNKYGDLQVEAHLYRVTEKGAVYSFWSLKNLNFRQKQADDTEGYLDDCADLVWESLLAPERERLPKSQERFIHMSYAGSGRSRALPGREYTISLGRSQGATNFYVAGDRIFVLTVLNIAPDEEYPQRFLRSFASAAAVKSDTDSKGDAGNQPGSMMGEGFGPGRGTTTSETGGATGGGEASGTPDYNRTFRTREVTERARILTRPAPSYTESARKYSVTGTVILRAVFDKDGEVKSVKVVKGLPHGLTAAAVRAAKLIKFVPAQLSGRNVSQYIQVEYNFNLY